MIGSSVLLLVLFSSKMALAHGGKTHDERSQNANKKEQADLAVKLEQVAQSYQRQVAPIFKKSCLECHGGEPIYPWYYKLPGVKQLIDSDINEARRHLDISKGFPFKGHGSPREDLEAIRNSVQKNEMPPFRYWIMNWDAKLSDRDKQAIYKWVDQSLKLLGEGEKHNGH